MNGWEEKRREEIESWIELAKPNKLSTVIIYQEKKL